MSIFFREKKKRTESFPGNFFGTNSGANPTSSSLPMFLTITQQCTDSHDDWTSMECPCERKLNVFEVQSFSFGLIYILTFRELGASRCSRNSARYIAAKAKDVLYSRARIFKLLKTSGYVVSVDQKSYR